MTLFRLLLDEMKGRVAHSANVIHDDKAFYKEIGKAEMCRDLIDMLSDDTLATEVKHRLEVLKKKHNLD